MIAIPKLRILHTASLVYMGVLGWSPVPHKSCMVTMSIRLSFRK